MGNDERKFIPALRYHFLTRFFDLIVQFTMPERAFKGQLIQVAGIKDNFRILDLGSGTGTLLILLKKKHPLAEVIGIDVDPEVIKLAEQKIKHVGLEIRIEQGAAEKLPYADDSFDRVLSSLVLHHLNFESKLKALEEAYRILKPGGEIYIADFGKPHGVMMYIVSLIVRHLEEVKDNVDGRIPGLMEKAGFHQVKEFKQYSSLYGTVSLYSGVK